MNLSNNWTARAQKGVIKEAKEFFYHLHDIEVNQKYADILPYSFHLSMVEAQAFKFQHLIQNADQGVDVMIGIYGHDSIEDARLTYNNVKAKFGFEAAEIIYLCTENKGRTRSERKPTTFYFELNQNPLAVFVKLCDLIANVKFGLLNNSKMYNTYKIEYESKIRPILHCEQFDEMFVYLNKLFEIQ